MNTVVITGFGALTPLGNDAASTWQAMRQGESGISTIEQDWVDDLPVHFAGQVKADLSQWIDRVQSRRIDRVSQLALVAAREAWSDAGFNPDEPSGLDEDRIAVSVGSGIGGLATTLTQWDLLKDKGVRRVSPFTVPGLMTNAPAAHVGLLVGARAGVHAPVSACASSNEAVAQGIDMIRLGRADVAIVGGAEATLLPLPIAGFAQMQALSKRNDDPAGASRPWDVDRDGFVLSEGATLIVIESLDSARARGAHIYATLAGAGISADSHDLVQPDPDGRGQRSAMVRALADAKLSPADVNHINAHGTSTPQGDTTEAHSISEAFGQASDDIVVTSTKSMTGHLLGAAGALETFATAMALKDRLVPPTINLDNPESGLPIDVAAKTARALPTGDLAAVNNSFGFGGHNIAVVITNENATD